MNNINDNSNNNINIEARSAYASALMNVFDRIVNNENTYINPNSIFENSMSSNSLSTPYIVPNQLFGPRNSNIRNLLRETLSQKNSYKKVLSEKGSAQIKKLKFTENLKNNKCPILLEKFEKDEEVSVLPCEHVFNTEAINEWLKTEQANCPVCRFELDSKEIKISPLPSITEENESDADSDLDGMPELEEIFNEQDISNNLYTSDTHMIGLIETLLNMRHQRPTQPIENNNISSSFNSMINNMENSREVQAAILASINENNGNNNND